MSRKAAQRRATPVADPTDAAPPAVEVFAFALGDRVYNRHSSEIGRVIVQARNVHGDWYNVRGAAGGELGWWHATDVAVPPRHRPPNHDAEGGATPVA